MRSAWRDRYGGPDVVDVREIERPSPSGDQVLVKVHAASVNRADIDAILPKPKFLRLFMGIRAPREHRLGVDAAGVVEAAGPEATRFKTGDRVFGDMLSSGGGAFAEFLVARERFFEPIPEGLSFEVAATLPHSAVLALQALRLRNGRTVQAGDRVLIDGASGNVGPFAVQLAKLAGAEVTGAASAGKLDFVRSLGADHAIDYRADDYTRSGERYDWIVDVDKHHSTFRIPRALRPNGAYVSLGGNSRAILGSMLLGGPIGKLTGHPLGLMLWWKPFHPPDVRTITDLVLAGKLTPVIDRRYPLTDLVEALRWVDEGHARGKVVVIP
jgi:NADPH:quinone reductase-like Zn-dependent oxidoreductase